MSKQQGQVYSLIYLLLVFIFASTLVLTWQTWQSVRSQSKALENVVSDYSDLAASQFIRNVATEVSYRGYYSVMQSLLASDSKRPVASAEAAKNAVNILVGDYFKFSSSSIEVWDKQSNQIPAPKFLTELAEDNFSSPRAFKVLHIESKSQYFTLVFHNQKLEDGNIEVLGFIVNRDGWKDWIPQTLNKNQLLPPLIANRGVTNDKIILLMQDEQQASIFSSGDLTLFKQYPQLVRDYQFSDTYQGVFKGFSVKSLVDPSLVNKLVIGGLPEGQLLVLLILVVISLTLLLFSIFLLRKQKKLSEQREGFVARVSHELRTPLAQIRLFSETLLLDRVKEEKTKQRAIQIIDREAKRLSQLVDNILQFSSSEHHPAHIVLSEFNVCERTEEVIEQFSAIAKSKLATIELTCTEELIVAMDSDAYVRILINLLDNAVKYGPTEQTISIRIGKQDQEFYLEVADQGPGINKKWHQRIWQPFIRVEDEVTEHIAGTGIGLSVVKELVDQHSGSVNIKPVEPCGVCFRVMLPLSACDKARINH